MIDVQLIITVKLYCNEQNSRGPVAEGIWYYEDMGLYGAFGRNMILSKTKVH